MHDERHAGAFVLGCGTSLDLLHKLTLQFVVVLEDFLFLAKHLLERVLVDRFRVEAPRDGVHEVVVLIGLGVVVRHHVLNQTFWVVQ